MSNRQEKIIMEWFVEHCVRTGVTTVEFANGGIIQIDPIDSPLLKLVGVYKEEKMSNIKLALLALKKWNDGIMYDRSIGFFLSSRTCPFCQKFRLSQVWSPAPCAGCPIQEATGEQGCYGTPYTNIWAATDTYVRFFRVSHEDFMDMRQAVIDKKLRDTGGCCGVINICEPEDLPISVYVALHPKLADHLIAEINFLTHIVNRCADESIESMDWRINERVNLRRVGQPFRLLTDLTGSQGD